jgi:hypothetical protein
MLTEFSNLQAYFKTIQQRFVNAENLEEKRELVKVSREIILTAQIQIEESRRLVDHGLKNFGKRAA